jgi:hypothetical protein
MIQCTTFGMQHDAGIAKNRKAQEGDESRRSRYLL